MEVKNSFFRFYKSRKTEKGNKVSWIETSNAATWQFGPGMSTRYLMENVKNAYFNFQKVFLIPHVLKLLIFSPQFLLQSGAYAEILSMHYRLPNQVFLNTWKSSKKQDGYREKSVVPEFIIALYMAL